MARRCAPCRVKECRGKRGNSDAETDEATDDEQSKLRRQRSVSVKASDQPHVTSKATDDEDDVVTLIAMVTMVYTRE